MVSWSGRNFICEAVVLSTCDGQEVEEKAEKRYRKSVSKNRNVLET